VKLYEKLNQLQHAEACEHLSGEGCICGLSEVRAAVHELLAAADAVYSENSGLYDSRDIMRMERLGSALSVFDAQDDAGRGDG
jgi:hypothetical protein